MTRRHNAEHGKAVDRVVQPGFKEVVRCQGMYQGRELTSNLSGNTRPQSAQFALPLWADTGLKSGICAGKLISTKKKFF